MIFYQFNANFVIFFFAIYTINQTNINVLRIKKNKIKIKKNKMKIKKIQIKNIKINAQLKVVRQLLVLQIRLRVKFVKKLCA